MLALVGMAFFAVIREGFETAVFLLAAFDASTDPLAAGGGALLGSSSPSRSAAGIYRGGVKIDLARFFRFTGVVLVLVAAGLVASAAAHRARGRLAQRASRARRSTSSGSSSRAASARRS